MANLSRESHDVQGIIVTGYQHLQHSVYMFLGIKSAIEAKNWLAAIVNEITTSYWEKTPEGVVKKPEFALNIAFTYTGIKSLDYPAASLATFSEEFQQGMVEQSRSRRLGDIGSHSPDKWEIGGLMRDSNGDLKNTEIDVLLILQGTTPLALSQFCNRHRDLILRYGLEEVAPAQEGYLTQDSKEHFGFKDSISQPEIENSPKKLKMGADVIQTGEFILGYPNSYGSLPPTPTVQQEADNHNNLPEITPDCKEKDFGRNGSYLIFRKMRQDVAGFRKYFREKFVDAEYQKLMQAKFVGRWQNGTPLALSPESDDPSLAEAPKNNNFLYMAKDPNGFGCPIGSHIRRTNPRDSLRGDPAGSIISVNRHRIIRRGASYGEPLPPDVYEDDGIPRGILFFCINADIQRQFEFVQQTWINNPKFHGLYNDRDPLIGNNHDPQDPNDKKMYDMTVQSSPIRHRLVDVPQFATVCGGGYFFLPSISALYYLAGVKKPSGSSFVLNDSVLNDRPNSLV